jgi:hypothetical protein
MRDGAEGAGSFWGVYNISRGVCGLDGVGIQRFGVFVYWESVVMAL